MQKAYFSLGLEIRTFLGDMVFMLFVSLGGGLAFLLSFRRPGGTRWSSATLHTTTLHRLSEAASEPTRAVLQGAAFSPAYYRAVEREVALAQLPFPLPLALPQCDYCERREAASWSHCYPSLPPSAGILMWRLGWHYRDGRAGHRPWSLWQPSVLRA